MIRLPLPGLLLALLAAMMLGVFAATRYPHECDCPAPVRPVAALDGCDI